MWVVSLYTHFTGLYFLFFLKKGITGWEFRFYCVPCPGSLQYRVVTPPYGLSKYLLKIIQPTLNKSQHKIKNSAEFVNEAETWKISPTEVQVSYDVVNLYPSVPLDKAIDVIVEYLTNDFKNVKTRRKLTLVDIHQLIELYVSECYFLYNNLIWKLYNSGPIITVTVVASVYGSIFYIGI